MATMGGRRSGRTTRMWEEALKQAVTGQRVIIFMANESEVDRAQRWFRQFGFCDALSVRGRVTVSGSMVIQIRTPPMRSDALMGMSHTKMYWDHYIDERRFGLDAWRDQRPDGLFIPGPTRESRYTALRAEGKTLGEINAILADEGFSEVFGEGVMPCPTKSHEIVRENKGAKKMVREI